MLPLFKAMICQPTADVSPGCRGVYRQPPPTGSWAAKMKFQTACVGAASRLSCDMAKHSESAMPASPCE